MNSGTEKVGGMRLLWMTDLHLDRAQDADRHKFLASLRSSHFDAAVITGDISSARFLRWHLLDLGRACDPKPVYFVLGNHDFFGGSFAGVDELVADICQRQKNLRHLGSGEIIPLTETEALIGHRGWADGLAGYGFQSRVRQKDFEVISDFRGESKKDRFCHLEALGAESGHYLRGVLPKALENYHRVWIATHFPPYPDAALFGGRRCGMQFLPHFTNVGAGKAIYEVAKDFREKRVTVLCGHTHHASNLQFSANISVLVGAARPSRLGVQEVLNFKSETPGKAGGLKIGAAQSGLF